MQITDGDAVEIVGDLRTDRRRRQAGECGCIAVDDQAVFGQRLPDRVIHVGHAVNTRIELALNGPRQRSQLFVIRSVQCRHHL